jgi:hypothetical protein
MVCSSIVFIPGVMIYEFVKAWKATKGYQNQVKESLDGIFVIEFLEFLDFERYATLLTDVNICKSATG